MANFFQIGSRWLNLEQITNFEFVPSKTNSDKFIVTVHFASGAEITLTSETEIKNLEAFLHTHHAT